MADTIFNSTLKTDYNERPPEIDFSEFDKVVRSRRSVRVFEDHLIPEEVVEKALGHALLAPNSSNLQPWEFHWVRSLDLKKQLAKFCFNQNGAKTASDLIVCVANTNTWKEHCKLNLEAFEKSGKEVPNVVKQYYTKIAPSAYGFIGPLGILSPLKWLFFNFLGIFTVMARAPIWPSDLKLWATKTTSLACENIMLSARAQGYDSLPMEGFDEVRVKKLLNLNRKQHVVMVIALGKRSEGGVYGPQVRFEKERFIYKH